MPVMSALRMVSHMGSDSMTMVRQLEAFALNESRAPALG